jgi:hypothetical protein
VRDTRRAEDSDTTRAFIGQQPPAGRYRPDGSPSLEEVVCGSSLGFRRSTPWARRLDSQSQRLNAIAASPTMPP